MFCKHCGEWLAIDVHTDQWVSLANRNDPWCPINRHDGHEPQDDHAHDPRTCRECAERFGVVFTEETP